MKFRDYSNYEVFEDGKIWSYNTKNWLKPSTRKDGYQTVHLYDNEWKRKLYLVHRIVYETFSCEPIPEGIQVNHINECKSDNRFCNLNLMTPKQNTNWGSGIERARKSRSKKVGAYKNGELVMTFKSSVEAGRNGFKQGAVSACCRCESKTHRGFEWKYL